VIRESSFCNPSSRVFLSRPGVPAATRPERDEATVFGGDPSLERQSLSRAPWVTSAKRSRRRRTNSMPGSRRSPTRCARRARDAMVDDDRSPTLFVVDGGGTVAPTR